MQRLRIRIGRAAGVLALATAFLIGPSRPAEAQFYGMGMGYGYPGFGYGGMGYGGFGYGGLGYGGLGYGGSGGLGYGGFGYGGSGGLGYGGFGYGGLGYGGFGWGYPGYFGYGYPFLGVGYGYGLPGLGVNWIGAMMGPGILFASGYGNPLFALGLSPLAVWTATTRTYLDWLDRTRMATPLPASTTASPSPAATYAAPEPSYPVQVNPAAPAEAATTTGTVTTRTIRPNYRILRYGFAPDRRRE